MVVKGIPDIIMDESVKRLACELCKRVRDDKMQVIVAGSQGALDRLGAYEVLVLAAHTLIARTAQYN